MINDHDHAEKGDDHDTMDDDVDRPCAGECSLAPILS